MMPVVPYEPSPELVHTCCLAYGGESFSGPMRRALICHFNSIMQDVDRLDAFNEACSNADLVLKISKLQVENAELHEREDRFVAAWPPILDRLGTLELTIMQVRDNYIKEIERLKITHPSEVDQEQFDSLIDRLYHTAGFGHDDIDMLKDMQIEIIRLKQGQFTPEEFQNLCHNLPDTCTREAFEQGCKEYQNKLFGEKATNSCLE